MNNNNSNNTFKLNEIDTVCVVYGRNSLTPSAVSGGTPANTNTQDRIRKEKKVGDED